MKKLLLSLTLLTSLAFGNVCVAASSSPSITSFSPTSGAVGTLVTVTGTNLYGGNILLSISGRYLIVVSSNATGDTLKGMVIPGTTSGALVYNSSGGTATSSGNFTVIASPYPAIQQGLKLTATDATGSAAQGTSIAVSADGNTAVVGASGNDGVWIYARNAAGIWSQQGTILTGTGETSAGSSHQGSAVAISADGNTVLVGGDRDGNSPNGFGAAWVFVRSNGTWTQQGSKLVGTDAVGPGSSDPSETAEGTSVALSADGNTAVVGGPNDNDGAGAVFVYKRTSGTWAEWGNKLVGSGASFFGGYGDQGYSVAISADGITIAEDSPNDNPGGATWVFTINPGTWTQQGSKLSGSSNTSVSNNTNNLALSADGKILLVGGDSVGALPRSGAQGWIYTSNGSTWTEKLSIALGVANTRHTVALSADGNTAVFGIANDNSGAGDIYTYTNNSGAWTLHGTVLVGTGAVGNAGQGDALSISADATTTLVGGNNDNSGLGASWVFIATPQPPSIVSFTPASGDPGTLVHITGANFANLDSVTIGGKLAIVVDNYGDSITAFVMPGAVTGAVTVTTLGGAISGAANFAVTATPYLAMQQGSKLTGTGATSNSRQGYAVAVSADGNTAVVGSYEDNSGIGAIWIYSRTGTAWAQQGSKMVGTGATGKANQGYSVAISADGNTVIEGGYADNSSAGGAWIFTRTAGVWSQQGNEINGTGAIGTNAQQGYSVGLSADGNTAVVGGYNDNSSAGAIWVFARSNGAWAQVGSKLVGTNATGTVSHQGFSSAISADGNTVIEGANNDNSAAGAVWIFANAAGTWSQQAGPLVGTGANGVAAQGGSVALSADGNTALVGGYIDSSQFGAVWVYTRTAGVWTQQGGKLVGKGAIGTPRQGLSVALSADGNAAIIGGYEDNSNVGATWVFTRTAGVWAQQGNKLVGTNATGSAQQGISVSLSADGTTGIIGGYFDNTAIGASWVFVACKPNTGDTIVRGCTTFKWYGTTYTTSGTATQILTNKGGCDSTVTMHLTISQPSQSAVNIGTYASSYKFKGTTETASGHFTYDTLNAGGCDSTINLYLTLYNTPIINASSTCAPTKLTLNGKPQPYMIQWQQNGVTVAKDSTNWKKDTGVVLANAIVNASGEAMDTAGNIYVANYSNVLEYLKGSPVGTPGIVVAQNGLYAPISVRLDGAGNLYVLDYGYDEVFKYPAGSNSSTVPTVVASGFRVPLDLNVDKVGNIYVSNAYGNTVMYFSAGDTTRTIVAANGLNTPIGVYVDAHNNLYVSNNSDDNVLMYPSGSNSSTVGIVVATGLNSPTGITGDANGNIYVANSDGPNVMVFNSSSTIAVDTIGTGNLGLPEGIMIDASGNLYVTDQDSSTVRMFANNIGMTDSVKLSGSYTAVVKAFSGSTITTTSVKIGAPTTSSMSQMACDSYTLNSVTYTSSNTYVQNLTNKSGCDSTLTLNLIINKSTTGDTIATACRSFTWHGTKYATSATPTYILTNKVGCDSTVTLQLTINNADTSLVTSGNELFAGAASATFQWLSCNNSKAIVSGATSANYIAVANGSYAVQVTQNGCVDTSSCYSIISTGVMSNTASSTDVDIFPLPNNGHFAMTLSGNGYTSVIIYDETGKQVYTQVLDENSTNKTMNLDLSMYSSGVYFARLLTNHGVVSKKIVIQK